MSDQPPAVLLAGDPNERITLTLGGRTSDATRRGFALLWEFERRAKIRWPGCALRIIQPAYNTTVAASEGTHDGADTWDWELLGVDNWYAESELAREVGLRDWVRNPSQGFGWHHHAIGPGLPSWMYGDLVPAQLDDFNRHALGLRNGHDSGSDPQCFTDGRLTHKLAPIFNYAEWKAGHTMLSAEDKDWLADLVDRKIAAALGPIANAVVQETVDTKPDGTKVNLKTAVRASYRDHADN
jgi:hypothetical protein